ncbi:hypothetical protein C8R45DRAFT_185692 [Mycena sanguinolenta]|nr:hypothetical protein C8R45DRAFT_185692 [Mycena sanguinolenta]
MWHRLICLGLAPWIRSSGFGGEASELSRISGGFTYLLVLSRVFYQTKRCNIHLPGTVEYQTHRGLIAPHRIPLSSPAAHLRPPTHLCAASSSHTADHEECDEESSMRQSKPERRQRMVPYRKRTCSLTRPASHTATTTARHATTANLRAGSRNTKLAPRPPATISMRTRRMVKGLETERRQAGRSDHKRKERKRIGSGEGQVS